MDGMWGIPSILHSQAPILSAHSHTKHTTHTTQHTPHNTQAAVLTFAMIFFMIRWKAHGGNQWHHELLDQTQPWPAELLWRLRLHPGNHRWKFRPHVVKIEG